MRIGPILIIAGIVLAVLAVFDVVLINAVGRVGEVGLATVLVGTGTLV